MSISSEFLWRFLDDVWDLLPSEDRTLFETYWSAQVQVAANLEQKALEAGLGTEVSSVPVYLTERWNRFVMNEDSCDLFSVTDSLVLVGASPAALSKSTALYDTLVVTSASGQIPHEQTILFFDDAPKSLNHSDIIKGTVSLTYGLKSYTEGIDFVVNYVEGTVYAVEEGRIPPTDLMVIKYQVGSYVRDVDYTVDELTGMISRTTSSMISSGATVKASYTYNGTPTIDMTGSAQSLSGDWLTDSNADFSTLLPGRTLTIISGPNIGTYTINAVISPKQIQVAQPFLTEQLYAASYSINAFPHGIKVAKSFVSIPTLINKIDNADFILKEGIDYAVRDGILAVKTAFPVSTLGPKENRSRQMWAEETKLNKNTPYRNFGVLIDFYRSNSEAYKLALQGLWYTFWTGSTPRNLQRGLQILLGLPFAKRAGTVTAISADYVSITDARGFTITYTVPSGLETAVSLGESVTRFQELTDGVEIVDRNNSPGFVTNRIGRGGIQRFLTSKATKGTSLSSDESKALDLLEHHLFVPQILTQSITASVDVPEMLRFLSKMKPSWTEFAFSFLSEEEEGLKVSEETPPPQWEIDLSTTVSSNEWNQVSQYDSYLLHSISGYTTAGDTQATGNFKDLATNFTTLGIGEDDHVIIFSGAYKGIYRVIRRVSTTVLAIEIPDASIVSALNIDYAVYTKEMLLDHDAINFRGEHYIFPGTQFLGPSTLNTKTDFDFSTKVLSNADVKAMLLADIGNTGAEVQGITDADVSTDEISVATPPGLGAAPHEICSAALIRDNTGGPGITHVFAI